MGLQGIVFYNLFNKLCLKSSWASCRCCWDWEAALVHGNLLCFPPVLILTRSFSCLALCDNDSSLPFHEPRPILFSVSGAKRTGVLGSE